MATELIREIHDVSGEIAGLIRDDGDIAFERFLRPSPASANPFFVSDDPLEGYSHSRHATPSMAAELTDPIHDIAAHPDFTHFGIEDIHVTEVDLSGFAGQ